MSPTDFEILASLGEGEAETGTKASEFSESMAYVLTCNRSKALILTINRLRQLISLGLVLRVGRTKPARYGLTTAGRAALREELEASATALLCKEGAP